MKTSTKVIIAVSSAIAVIGIGVGTFFLVKHISDQNYQHRLEMAADCAKSYEKVSAGPVAPGVFTDEHIQANVQTANNKTKKLEECSSKYDITQTEITNKIGNEYY